jgi:ubiquinone/menaquinone biosynthesis C-methylase UbiE
MNKQSQFWDKMAMSYSIKSVPSQENYEKKLSLTQKLFSPDMKVLEIGCGTGTTSLLHASHVDQIVACDFSSEMIKIAKSKMIDKNISNVIFKQESVEDMNYKENEFDVIMAHSILHLVENKEEAIRRIYKSLKPGGYFITSTGCIGGMLNIFKPLWYIGYSLGKLPYIGFFTKAKFTQLVETSGFVIEKNWAPTKLDIFLITKKKEG